MSSKLKVGKCRHAVDPNFPTEVVGAFLVARCIRCAAIVALKKK